MNVRRCRWMAMVWACCAGLASAQTNTNIRGTVTAFDGRTVSVTTREGKAVEVRVPAGTPMSQSVPGNRSDIKAGETNFIAARIDDQGKLTAARVQVSTNGVKPTQ